MIFDKVLNTIRTYKLIEPKDKIVLGISGGPDSVTLLHILSRLKETMDIEIYAAHLNHQMRGIESQKDALYVSEICKEMNIVYFLKSIDVPTYCKENGLSIEEGARKLRYEMFDEIKEKTKSNKISIGHNLNDQAETILMRMMRGTGLQGLRGIEYHRNDGVIRPLLDIDRSDIEKYCEQHQLNPRIDHTNLESIYTRNKIRLELIPYMQDNFNPNLIESISRMSSNLRDDSDYIEDKAKIEFDNIAVFESDSVELDVEKYTRLHNAIKVRVLRLGIKQVLGDTNFIDQKHIDDIIELEKENKINKQINLPRGLFVYRKQNTIILTTKEIVNEEIEFCYNIPNNGFVKIKELGTVIETQTMTIDRYKSMKSDKQSKGFDLNKIKGGLTVSNRRQGDKIKLAMGTKKLKSLFVDLKIPREERSKVPVIRDEEGILLVGDYKTSEDYKIDLNTKEVLKVTFKKL